MESRIGEILSYLMPHLVVAGAYSARIQQHVGVHDAKEGDTIFHHALSDADLSIQAFLEVVLLARFPDLSFFSEEQDRSLNKKYFPEGRTLEVLLDPIDGTRKYVDGREHYQIIVTLHDEREIVGALCYLPRKDRCFIAEKGKGARCLSSHEMVTGGRGVHLDVSSADGPLLVFNAPELVRKVSPHLAIKDLVTSYISEPDFHNATDVLEGLSQGMIWSSCQAIDGGAIAFIAAEAGAIATDFDGNAFPSFRTNPKRVVTDVLLAVNEAVHKELLRLLR